MDTETIKPLYRVGDRVRMISKQNLQELDSTTREWYEDQDHRMNLLGTIATITSLDGRFGLTQYKLRESKGYDNWLSSDFAGLVTRISHLNAFNTDNLPDI